MNLCMDCEFNQSTTSCEFNFVQEGEETTHPWVLFWRMHEHFAISSLTPFCVPQCSNGSGVKISFQYCVAVFTVCLFLFSLLFWLCAFFVIVSLRFSKHFLITHFNCWIYSFSGLCALPLVHVCFLLKPFVLLGCTIGIMRFSPKTHITQSYLPHPPPHLSSSFFFPSSSLF